MILRIKIVTPEYINDTLCGNNLELLDANVIVNLNGTEILNYTTGLSALWHELNISTDATWEENNVEVTVTMSGYHTYHNIFTIYGYDLGHSNLNTANPRFEIILIKEDYRTVLQQTELIDDDGFGNMIANPDYIVEPIRLTYASVIAYRRPFTNEIHYYNNVSGNVVSYYHSSTGVNFSSTNNGVICDVNDFGIIPYSVIFGINGGCCSPQLILVDECLGDEYIVALKTWTPTIGYNYISENCDTSCINNLDKNTAIVEINFADVDCLYVDDTLRAPFIDIYLNQEVWGIGSTIINNVIKGYITNSRLTNVGDYVDFECPIEVIDSDYGAGSLFRIEWEFITPGVGDYIINNSVVYDGIIGQTINGISPTEEVIETLKSNSVLYCINNETLASCNWYEIIQIECNKYKVYNRSFDAITLNIYKLNSNKEFDLLQTEEIGECNELDIQLVNDGVYRFEVVRNERTYIYLVINYCVIQDCYLNYLKNNICCNPTDDCKVEDTYDYNVFHSMVNVLMAQLNAEYNFNFIYEFISDEKLDELHNISTIIDRINTEYCIACDSPSGCNEIVNVGCTSCN